MKKLFIILSVIGLVLFNLTLSHVTAAEKVMEQDTVATVTQVPELVKIADNFIVLFDSSSSMNEPYLQSLLNGKRGLED
jgi:hypothetical protein